MSPEDRFQRGEMKRIIVSILAMSSDALTSREIAARLITERGLVATPYSLNAMAHRVACWLTDQRDHGLVENVKALGEKHLQWRLRTWP